jgi:hypothetical protein
MNKIYVCVNIKIASNICTQLFQSVDINIADHRRWEAKASTIFVSSNTGIVGSNPNRGMNVCVRVFCVRVVLCVCIGLATCWSPVQGILPTVHRLRNWKSGQSTKVVQSCISSHKCSVCINRSRHAVNWSENSFWRQFSNLTIYFCV